MDGKRKLGFLVLLVGFVVVAVFVGLTGPRSNRSVPSAILADGREVRLEAATCDRGHQVAFFSGWSRLRKVVPSVMTNWFPKPITLSTHRYDNNVLIAWISVEPTNAASMPFPGYARIVTSTGDLMPVYQGTDTNRMPDGRILHCYYIDSFPRRDRFITITGSVDRLPFSLRMENPLFGRTIPRLPTVSLPATNRVGDVDFVLNPFPVLAYPHQSRNQPDLLVYRDGVQLTNWIEGSFKWTDGTGNERTLLLNEPAWKLRFGMRALPIHGTRTNEFHDLKLARLLATNDMRIVPIGRTFQRQTVERAILGGPGKYIFDTNVRGAVPIPDIGQKPAVSSGSRFAWKENAQWLLLNLGARASGANVDVIVSGAEGRWFLPHRRNLRRGRNSFALFRLEENRLRRGMGTILRIEDLQPPYRLRISVRTNVMTEFIVDPRRLRALP